MIWSLLADSLVILHFAFTAFVIFGGFLTWRWPRVALAHVPALAWGCWVELSHSICPLTRRAHDEGKARGSSEGRTGEVSLTPMTPLAENPRPSSVRPVPR